MSLVLVSGGCGFIGSHLVDMLVAVGHQVVVIDNLSTGKVENLHPMAQLIEMDITDKEAVHHLFSEHRFDYVFHLAAQINLRSSIKQPAQDAQTNVLGTINLLENCRGIKKFLFASTGGAIYSPNYETIPWKEEDETSPSSPYGLSKFCAERYIELLSQQRGFQHAILRLSNVYGPRQNAHGEAGVIAIFADKIAHGQDCTIFGSGEQMRDFAYVGDVVRAFLLAMPKNVNGIFNVSTRQEVSVKDLTHTIFNIMGQKPRVNYADKIEGEMERSCLSYDKLNFLTGWRPEYVLAEGLAKTLGTIK